MCIGRAVRRGQDEHRGATYCTLSNLDSNISTPISVNQLCESDGINTLSIDEKMLLRMSPIIWMVEEAMLTCGLHCAWRICSRTQSTREGNEETASRPIWTLIVVLTVFNQFMDELIDCCDRIGGLGHIDVVDMPV